MFNLIYHVGRHGWLNMPRKIQIFSVAIYLHNFIINIKWAWYRCTCCAKTRRKCFHCEFLQIGTKTVTFQLFNRRRKVDGFNVCPEKSLTPKTQQAFMKFYALQTAVKKGVIVDSLNTCRYISMCFKLQHSANALSSIVSTLSPILTDFRFLHW